MKTLLIISNKKKAAALNSSFNSKQKKKLQLCGDKECLQRHQEQEVLIRGFSC